MSQDADPHPGLLAADVALRELLEALCEGSLSAAQCDELDRRLLNDRDAQLYYLAYIQLDARLRWTYRDRPGEVPPGAVQSVIREIEAELADKSADDCPSPASRWKSQWSTRAVEFFIRPTPLSFGIATLVMSLIVVVMAWTMVPIYRSFTQVDPASHEVVAQITRTHAASWATGQTGTLPGSFLMSGHQMELIAGIVEINFHDGAQTMIEGPARFRVDSRSSATLDQGKLVARISQPARGFAVQTESVLVVDLGTEFGLEVRPGEGTHVAVMEGKVEVRDPQQHGAQAQLITRLVAGESLQVAHGGQLVRNQPSAGRYQQILLTRDSQGAFREDFEHGPHEPEFGAKQADTGLELTVGNTYRGWTGTGKSHAVDWAAMFYADHQLTSPAIWANHKGTTYQVDFDGGPGVYARPDQQTSADERLYLEIINGRGEVLRTELFDPADWSTAARANSLPLASRSFTYVGDGQGAIRIRIYGTTSDDRFHGTIDNLCVTRRGGS
jgi:hypothetical protein